MRTKRINITYNDQQLISTLDKILEKQHINRSCFFRVAARNYIKEYEFLLKA